MTKAGEQPTITQADIEAAIPILRHLNLKGIVNTEDDAEKIRKAFARYRTASLAAQDGLVEALEHIVHLFDSRPITERLFKPSAVTAIRKALSAIKGDKS